MADSAVVGSSSTSTLQGWDVALTISVSWRWPAGMSATRRVGSMSTPMAANSFRLLAISARSSIRAPRLISRSRKTFWATVSVGTKLISWNAMETPAARAASAVKVVSGAPPIATVPEVGGCTPRRIFRMVDLPAPFSPSSAWTSPGRTSRLTPSRARTPPKCFDTSVMRTASGRAGVTHGAGGGHPPRPFPPAGEGPAPRHMLFLIFAVTGWW